MVMFNFQSRFIRPIELRTKTQTIRSLRRRNAVAGDVLQLQSGARFKPKRLGTAVCTGGGPITIDFDKLEVVYRVVDGQGRKLTIRVVSEDGLARFARHDGFDSWLDLRKFWSATHGPDLAMFEGWITLWGETFTPTKSG